MITALDGSSSLIVVSSDGDTETMRRHHRNILDAIGESDVEHITGQREGRRRSRNCGTTPSFAVTPATYATGRVSWWSTASIMTTHRRGVRRKLEPRPDLRDYASGFEWWDARDRSLQLALAILADYLNDDAKALS